jgi:ComF family protein
MPADEVYAPEAPGVVRERSDKPPGVVRERSDKAPGVVRERPAKTPGVAREPHGWRDRLFAALLPASCLSCAAPLAASARLGLCPGCRGRLRPLASACALCATPLAAAAPAGYVCGRCRARPPAYDRLLALWSYEPPLDAVVRGLKFGRLDYLGRHLGLALAQAFLGEMQGAHLVVPVPLHWRRRLRRGYNQAERIAQPLATALGQPLSRALRRRRATPPQSALGRPERLANPRRAFHARRREALAGRTVLLVDDVATTGATLEAAAEALKRAGAAAVVAVVAGRTPSE